MIDCRGRNGWFKFNRNNVIGNTWNDNKEINFYSKRAAYTPPIIFMGKKKELINLFEDILNKLKGGDT